MNIIFLSFIFLLNISFHIVECGPVYSDKEKVLLEQFLDLMKNDLYKEYMKSDPYLIRWLRVKDLNLNDAAEMLRTALKWRKANNIDTILTEKLYEFPGGIPFSIDGVDKEGSLISAFTIDKVDMRRAILTGKRDVAIRYWDQFMERGEMGTMKQLGIIGNETSGGPKVHLTTMIFDVGGYSIRKHGCLSCIGVYMEWLRHADDYYPGYLKHLIIINAPRIVLPLVELLKPVMAPPTRNALQVYSTDKNEWMPILRKLIDADQLRVNFGGTKQI